MSGEKPRTARQDALERLQAEDAEVTRAAREFADAMKAWAAAQQAADTAWLDVLRLQGELAAKRHAQKLARLILISTPDAPAAEPMGDGLQA